MKCPFCAELDNKVVDSRLSKEGEVIRRRRECLVCKRRFTTYEKVDEISTMVIKKDGRREPFNTQKILHGLEQACQKRPIGRPVLEELAERIEKKILDRGETEVASHVIGAEVMSELINLDHVAYVRFASVYREFKDINAFMEELKGLLQQDKQEKREQAG